MSTSGRRNEKNKCVCEVGTVCKISDYKPEGPGFKPLPGRGLNCEHSSFATPSVDVTGTLSRWYSLPTFCWVGDSKEPTHLSIRAG